MIVRCLRAALGAVVLVAGLSAPVLAADDYPNRPVHLVVPYPPGGSADLIGRMLAEKLSRGLGQTVVVENKGGASGTIGTESVARAQPDGYTLLIGISDTHAINPAVFARLNYNPQRDFTPISLLAVQPFALAVGPTVKAKTLAGFVEEAKSRATPMSFASNGVGGLQHLAMESFAALAGIKALHVPYKGAAPALTDVMGGHVDATFISLQGAGGNIKTDQLRALAITAPKRLANAPDIPTFAESGYATFTVDQWYGFFAPGKLPPALVAKLNGLAKEAMTSQDIVDKLVAVGTQPSPGTPEQFADFLQKEIAKWADVAKKNNVKIQ